MRKVTILSPTKTTNLPGEYIEMDVSVPFSDIVTEPQSGTSRSSSLTDLTQWLKPSVLPVGSGRVCIPNGSQLAVFTQKTEHICQIQSVVDFSTWNVKQHSQFSHPIKNYHVFLQQTKVLCRFCNEFSLFSSMKQFLSLSSGIESIAI